MLPSPSLSGLSPPLSVEDVPPLQGKRVAQSQAPIVVAFRLLFLISPRVLQARKERTCYLLPQWIRVVPRQHFAWRLQANQQPAQRQRARVAVWRGTRVNAIGEASTGAGEQSVPDSQASHQRTGRQASRREFFSCHLIPEIASGKTAADAMILVLRQSVSINQQAVELKLSGVARGCCSRHRTKHLHIPYNLLAAA
jgi:hypothetical protein